MIQLCLLCIYLYIQDLGLDFTLPGYPNIELRKGGRDMGVSLDNLAAYTSLVAQWLLVEGVTTQMEALRDGFNSVFPIASLQMFYPGNLFVCILYTFSGSLI